MSLLSYYCNQIRLSRVARDVLASNLTYLAPEKLIGLQSLIKSVRKIEGDFIECGLALGGSAILIASLMGKHRRFLGYDVFGMTPPTTDADDEKSRARYEAIKSGQAKGLGGNRYYGYEPDLYDKVKASFRAFGLEPNSRHIRLVKGLFENTLTFPEHRPVAFAHIDCDWHDPVKLCLERIYPVLAKGGVIVLDGYNDHGGCRSATDAFLADHADMTLLRTKPHAVIQRR